MKVSELAEVLSSHPTSALHIMLPAGGFVPSHFHVTEVGKVDKTFVDCGGIKRRLSSCVLQIWTANDIDHRLVAGKLAMILGLGKETLGSDDLPVEVEYGAEVIGLYTLDKATYTPGGILLNLKAKRTDCLAPDKCGVNKCCTGSSCC